MRWFHAAAFTPLLMVLVIGVGIQMTSGVVTGMTDDLSAAIGTAVPGVMLILVGCFAPLALFKLLAFVDPGTSSGAALRAGMAAAGGLRGLLGGASAGRRHLGRARAPTAPAAPRARAPARSATSARFAQCAGGFLGTVGGSLGGAASRALGAAASLAAPGPRSART